MSDLTGSLIIWLRPQLAPVPVHAAVPRDLPASFVTLRRIGGPFDPPVIDRPTIELAAWGATQAQAEDLAYEARALVWSLDRGGIINGIAVYRVEEFTGPAWLPDPNHDNRPRYVQTFSIRHREHLAVP
jgi:hypothetical protein